MTGDEVTATHHPVLIRQVAMETEHDWRWDGSVAWVAEDTMLFSSSSAEAAPLSSWVL